MRCIDCELKDREIASLKHWVHLLEGSVRDGVAVEPILSRYRDSQAVQPFIKVWVRRCAELELVIEKLVAFKNGVDSVELFNLLEDAERVSRNKKRQLGGE